MDRQKRVMHGVVTSNKMAKTITVKVTRTVQHPKYHKFMKRHDQYHAHDELNRCKEGDLVSIMECRPYSKTKTFILQNIIQTVEV